MRKICVCLFLTLLFLLFILIMPSTTQAVETIYSSLTGSDCGGYTCSTDDPGHTKSSYAGQTITIPAGVGYIIGIYFDDVWVGNDTTVIGQQVGMNSEIRVYDGPTRIATARADVLPTGGVSGSTYATFSPGIAVTPGKTYYFELYSLDNLDTRNGGIVVKVPVALGGSAYPAGIAYYDPDNRYFVTPQSNADLAKVRVFGTLAIPADKATCGIVSYTSPIYPDQTFTAQMSLTNTGDTTWATGGTYYLGSQNSPDTFWGVTRVGPDYTVTPGMVARFTGLNFKAPSTVGTYNFYWRMINDTTWFGDLCTFQVTVSSPSGANLSTLNIGPGPNGGTAIAGGIYTMSGLRISAGGKNHYNDITVTQNVTNSPGADLTAVAFTSQSSSPSSFATLMQAADSGGGFILVYAQNARSVPLTPSGGSKELPANTYWVYHKGGWNNITSARYGILDSISYEISVEKNLYSSVPAAPAFDVGFNKILNNKSWKTYGYLLRSDNTQTIIQEIPVKP